MTEPSKPGFDPVTESQTNELEKRPRGRPRKYPPTLGPIPEEQRQELLRAAFERLAVRQLEAMESLAFEVACLRRAICAIHATDGGRLQEAEGLVRLQTVLRLERRIERHETGAAKEGRPK